MRKILILAMAFSFGVLTPAISKEPDGAQKLKLAEEIVEATQMDQMVGQLGDAIIASQRQALSATFKNSSLAESEKAEIFEKLGEVIREELAPAMKDFATKTAPILADVYTKEELEGIAAFYRSTAGKAMIAKQGELMQKSMAVAQEWNEKNLPAVIQRMQPRIQKIVDEARNRG
jgi:hypothetical protein